MRPRFSITSDWTYWVFGFSFHYTYIVRTGPNDGYMTRDMADLSDMCRTLGTHNVWRSFTLFLYFLPFALKMAFPARPFSGKCEEPRRGRDDDAIGNEMGSDQCP